MSWERRNAGDYGKGWWCPRVRERDQGEHGGSQGDGFPCRRRRRWGTTVEFSPRANPSVTRRLWAVMTCLSVSQCSRSVMSDSLRPHGLQHARLCCPPPSPGACSELMSTESVMPSNHLILRHPLLLLPSIFPSIRVSSNESVFRIRWPKYWSFSFGISPSNEYSGLISFRMDWLDLLTVQGTRKSLLQHNSSKASILQHSAFFTVQLSYPYMTIGKTTALTRWTFVGKVMSAFEYAI